MDRSFFRFGTMHEFDRHTDRRTDRILIARPRLQRGKNDIAVHDAARAVGLRWLHDMIRCKRYSIWIEYLYRSVAAAAGCRCKSLVEEIPFT